MAQQSALNYDSFFVKPGVNIGPGMMPHKYDFAGANPGPDVLPIADLAEAARAAVLETGSQLSLYPPVYGAPAMREFVVEKMREHRGLTWATTEDVLVTNGSLHGIALVLDTMVQPGDVVLTDRFIYQGAVNRFQAVEAQIEVVDGDEDGMRMDALEEVLRGLRAAGKRPKFIYTVPSPQNPDGSIMPVERRKRMIALAEEYDTLIFEDDCYVYQTLDVETMPPAIVALDGGKERVVYISTFSKIIGPGIRLGWMIANPSILPRIAGYKQDGGKDYLSSMIVTKYLQGHMETRILELNELLRRKRTAVVAALRENFGPQLQFEEPTAGMFLWVRFPEGSDLLSVEQQVQEKGVRYLSGPHFSPKGEGANYARFNYCNPATADLADGINIFAEVLRAEGTIKG